MSKRPPSGDVDVRLGSEAEPSREPLDPETPFRLLVLGDFGGGSGPLAARKLHAVDRDVVEEELGRLRAAADVALGEGRRATIAPRTLEDFHPDRLLEKVEALAELGRTRARLEDARTFVEAAREVRAWAGPPAERGESAPPAAAAKDDVVGELLAYTREHLAAYKVPRSIDVVDELPRQETGKLYKNGLIEKYSV